MHMSDALISPMTGGIGYLVSGTAITYSLYKLKQKSSDFQIPLMGIMGAFIFAAQMINFTIPGTGSSGHICGSLLLAVLLGPYAATIVISSVLMTQALFFADGGLLSLGCNIINMGIIPCFIAYPLIYLPLVGDSKNRKRIWFACITASILGLQLGALSVVLETTFSGISELPFKEFSMLMLPIHLPIGLMEGIITAFIVNTIKETRPELLLESQEIRRSDFSLKKVYIGFAILTLLTGGFISWFASEHPDGLEWAIGKTGFAMEEAQTDTTKINLNKLQETTSILPDYNFPAAEQTKFSELSGRSISGIIGSIITLLIAIIAGITIKLVQAKTQNVDSV